MTVLVLTIHSRAMDSSEQQQEYNYLSTNSNVFFSGTRVEMYGRVFHYRPDGLQRICVDHRKHGRQSSAAARLLCNLHQNDTIIDNTTIYR